MQRHLNSEILRRIGSGRFPFANNPVFKINPLLLANIERDRCIQLYKKVFPTELIQTKERGIFMRRMEELYLTVLEDITELESRSSSFFIQTAEEVIRELYNIPQAITFSSKLMELEEMDLELDIPCPEFISEQRKFELDDEVQRRIILSSLPHGSSVQLWKTAHYIVQEKINAFSPRLMKLYDTYAAVVSIYMWMMPIYTVEKSLAEGHECGGMKYLATQGITTLDFKEGGGAEIQVEANTFPVLLHELNKGVIDYLICRGLPQNVTASELQYIYSKSDAYNFEPWHYFLSPSLWSGLLTEENVTPANIPFVLAKVSTMNLNELTIYFSEIINNLEHERNKAPTNKTD